MKSVVCHGPKDLRIEETATPTVSAGQVLIGEKRIPLAPLLTGVFPIDEAVSAFEAANDRKTAMKVQLSFA